MRTLQKSVLLLAVSMANLPAGAAIIPASTRADPRISYVRYSRDDVTVVPVQRGTVTRIVLGADEKIGKDGTATGFPSDCTKPDLEWCIHADPGTNQVLVKPKEGATHNNLELKTDLRDYSFQLRVLPDAGPTRAAKSKRVASAQSVPMFRVMFTYPEPDIKAVATTVLARLATAAERLPLRTTANTPARPAPRNWRYTMQLAPGSSDIAPTLVFDDGRFTYFRFPANREVPTIFALSPQGEESRVNFHIDAGDSSLFAVQRMGRRFVLRLGASAVGIWNEAFDPDGVPPVAGTTVRGVIRDLREGK
ncbi:TrbG/VirB9 family P-type conjugative transfer protein [Massilia sp. R2A-15]|uniref:TrbG/VirB9 family P-type conjugative transfer protein n=1 Tax=Massilia sp. R2A-15 TaxID=3064278 RepID=UPI0027341D37|nr:TrbG/VirB9 family P-type conjugative transfer protein [Massilia sp. R2A-15]WLI91078.1 TrbG/VirB9 family P-type conjugative transfer protein [Massilia sp. R2A-15]